MPVISVIKIDECPNGTHKHFTVSIDGVQERWSVGPEDFETALASIPSRIVFMLWLRNKIRAERLGKPSLARIKALCLGGELEY